MALKSLYRFHYEARQEYINWDRTVKIMFLFLASTAHLVFRKMIKKSFSILREVFLRGIEGPLVQSTLTTRL